MLTLNVRLKNAEEVNEFKRRIAAYDNNVSMVVGKQVVARPMLTCSPYITPLDDITLHCHGMSLNEFTDMIAELNQFITDRQDSYTLTIMKTVESIRSDSVIQEEDNEIT